MTPQRLTQTGADGDCGYNYYSEVSHTESPESMLQALVPGLPEEY